MEAIWPGETTDMNFNCLAGKQLARFLICWANVSRANQTACIELAKVANSIDQTSCRNESSRLRADKRELSLSSSSSSLAGLLLHHCRRLLEIQFQLVDLAFAACRPHTLSANSVICIRCSERKVARTGRSRRSLERRNKCDFTRFEPNRAAKKKSRLRIRLVTSDCSCHKQLAHCCRCCRRHCLQMIPCDMRSTSLTRFQINTNKMKNLSNQMENKTPIGMANLNSNYEFKWTP